MCPYLSVPMALFGILVSDWDEVQSKGFFHGYDALIYLIVFLQVNFELFYIEKNYFDLKF